jgi:hypothetical protein
MNFDGVQMQGVDLSQSTYLTGATFNSTTTNLAGSTVCNKFNEDFFHTTSNPQSLNLVHCGEHGGFYLLKPIP